MTYDQKDAVHSALPKRIGRLNELAYNLWWSWNPNAREVYRRLDYALWKLTAHNPVRMLRLIPPEKLEQAASSESFLQLYDGAIWAYDRALATKSTWWSRQFGDLDGCSIAYFSAEFALHQSLPLYAGGLGVLAGDHCKEASDLGLPLIGVGFMYPQGYFHQTLDSNGLQIETYETLRWDDIPVQRALVKDGRQCIVDIPLGGRTVLASVWQVNLGRVKLYLLDTDLAENGPCDRTLSARLYAGDRAMRLQQEAILGIGGVRALRSLGFDPAIWHLNEGHVAFVTLERIRELLDRGHSFEAACHEVRRTTIFTTHTPVPAGHDVFSFHLIQDNLQSSLEALGGHRDEFLTMGRYDNGGEALFNMTALAIRTSAVVNSVSRLHKHVTDKMWAPILRGCESNQQPLKAITNGVHMSTWIAPSISKLFERYLGPDWRDYHDDTSYWDRVLSIPDEELWAARQSLRDILLAFIRERARRRWIAGQANPAQVIMAGTLLDPRTLTIGFARRFTGYKRPELVFHDAERLARILSAHKCPVQIVFAGKAHPADEVGKHHLQGVCRRANDPAFGGRVAFVDDYDLHVAHFFVQGCDVWLNTPLKPQEASGTSGMKASINGAIHVGVGDGWWAEGYLGNNGWLIEGKAAEGRSQDDADAEALYRLLEEEIVPMFYDRDARGVPRRWVQIVKQAIRTIAPRFCTRRMVKQYAEEMYVPTGRPTFSESYSSNTRNETAVRS
jgi:starch phosphorylase